MAIEKISNIFSEQELSYFNNLIKEIEPTVPRVNGNYINYSDYDGTGLCKELGRFQIGDLSRDMPKQTRDRLTDIANTFSDYNLSLSHGAYARYSSEYGIPDLPPHFDHDTNDLIINFQLKSNVSWDIGIGLKLYSLEDNSAAIFNANTNIHWRPKKSFKNNEYIEMIFFRFGKVGERSDYSHLNLSQNDEIFKEVNDFRNRL